MDGELSLADMQRQRDEQRRAAVHAPPPPPPPSGDGDSGEAEGAEQNEVAYGYYRGVHDRAGYIEFQSLQGPWLAPGYAWLPCPVWLPDAGRGQGILLEYVTGLKILVRGRNLREMYQRILRQQVFRVTEMGEEADQYLPPDKAVTYAFAIDQPKEEAKPRQPSP